MNNKEILAELNKRGFTNIDIYYIFNYKDLKLVVEEAIIYRVINRLIHKKHHNKPVDDADEKALANDLMVTPEQLYKYFKKDVSKVSKENFIKLIDREYSKKKYNLI